MLTILEYVEMLFGFVPWHPLSRIKMMMPPVSCSVDSFPRRFECTQLFSRSWIWILLQSLQRETWNPSQVVWNLPSVRSIVRLKADWIAPPKTIEERPPVQKYSLATRWLKRSSLSSSLLFIFAGFGPRLPPREHKRNSRKAVSSWRAPLILQRSA